MARRKTASTPASDHDRKRRPKPFLMPDFERGSEKTDEHRMKESTEQPPTKRVYRKRPR